MNSLQENGYTTIPIYKDSDLKEIRKKLDEEVSNFQEFKNDATTFVLGGFSAFGNPSSFHNPTVRKIRLDVYEPVKQLFKDENRKFEQIIDRMLIRNPGLKPSKESWHRDISPETLETDTIFGGWINLSNEDQYFSCISGTHNDKPGNNRKGFATIKDKNLIRQYNNSPNKTLVKILPGHLIIFNENIIHEVVSKSSKARIVRLFIGWRLTNEDTPLIPNLEKLLEEQAVIPLKSFQIPPLYATLHFVNWRNKLVDFSQHVNEKCLEDRTVRSGQEAGTTYRIVQRHMKSLKEYDFNLYPLYSEQELNILKPQIICSN